MRSARSRRAARHRGVAWPCAPFAICLVLIVAMLASLTNRCASAAETLAAADVEALYRKGVLPAGALLVGQRASGMQIKGADAACVSCHRRSGLGTAEGLIVIPPIASRYLFRPAAGATDDMDFRYAPGYVDLKRQPYTEATLAAAIRSGIGRDGKPLKELMPRFDIDDDTMAKLIGYLGGLSSTLSPGVTEDTIHFATIVTPDADSAGRDGMLAVLRQFFSDHNDFLRGGAKPMVSNRNLPYRVTRHWQLHVWELQGQPDTWERQLHEKLAAEPVFAVISGIGGKTWAPVHRFCESEALPCLFPNVDVPVVAEQDFYDVYFSRGVLLEADLIGSRLVPPAGRPQAAGRSGAAHRVVQVFQKGDIGEDGARKLSADFSASGHTIPIDRPLDSDVTPANIGRALSGLKPDDVVVLWLRPGALALLPRSPPGAIVYVSGLMGGLEHVSLPPAWRDTAVITYPVDLPVLRRIAMNFPLAWFQVRHVPVTNERVQANTYLSCQILSEGVTGILDLFHRDYLVEQIENMLSQRRVNGYFPRLGLAPGQRFASKGGYLVKLSGDAPGAVSAQDGWIVP
ncbi:cytochrome C [Paraburkholderia sediminicola]|uniref:cytochrome C n=1 Tax=Paraburkholderia sediminicola TaxID=458836 RepID=UPI0038B796ED